jgi:hypothetical protein
MGFETRKKESEEIYKTKSTDKWFNFFSILIVIFSIFAVATNLKGDWSDLFFLFPNYELKHYPVLFAIEIFLLTGLISFWYGLKLPVFYIQNKKVKFYLKKFFEGKKKEYNDFFYQAPVQTDELPRAKKVVFTKITPKDFFKEDYKNIVNLFRSNTYLKIQEEFENKKIILDAKILDINDEIELNQGNIEKIDQLKKEKEKVKLEIKKLKEKYEKELEKNNLFTEKEKTFNELIEIIEGVFSEYLKGKSRLFIKKILPNPFKTEQIQDASVFDLKEGKVYISVKQLLDVFDEFCKRFEKFLENYSKYKTRIYKLYSNELKSKEKRKQMMVYFKLVMFRRLFKLYMNIPAGWFVVRLQDYTARAIISVIDRETLVIIDSRNRGEIKGFPDDRDTRMFLLLYHYFFNKTNESKFYKHIFELLMPDKTAKEIENYILANKSELERKL